MKALESSGRLDVMNECGCDVDAANLLSLPYKQDTVVS